MLAQEPDRNHVLEREELIGDDGFNLFPSLGVLGDVENQALNLDGTEDRGGPG